MNMIRKVAAPLTPAELERVQQTLIETLAHFGIAVAAGDITKGPTITRYEVYPAKGVRVDKIVSLERDLARSTRAERIKFSLPFPARTRSESRSQTRAKSK